MSDFGLAGFGSGGTLAEGSSCLGGTASEPPQPDKQGRNAIEQTSNHFSCDAALFMVESRCVEPRRFEFVSH